MRALFASLVLLAVSLPATAGENWWDREPGDPPYIDPSLIFSTMVRGVSDDAVVIFLDTPPPDLSGAAALSWADRGDFVFSTLRVHAEITQAPVLSQLRAAGLQPESLEVFNAVFVRGPGAVIASVAAGIPGVAAVVREPELQNSDPVPQSSPGKLWEGDYPPHIEALGAADLLEQGITGQGVVVGVIDDGVRHTHEALVDSYRGNTGSGFSHDYNWFDGVSSSTTPTASAGHGTHVMGTIVGTGELNIGVAPGAQWVACRGCSSSSCPLSALNACGSFMLAPTRVNGTDPDPAVRPHIINNSWGDCGRSTNAFYRPVVDAWVASGQVPVFANGNSINCGYTTPPPTNTVSNPARYAPSFGVGSVSWETGLSSAFTNRGPTDDPNNGTDPLLPNPMGFPNIKPNVSAPGSGIFSAAVGGDAHYEIRSGTSMAAPAVSGVFALMKSVAPGLIGNYSDAATILMQTAIPVPVNTGSSSDGPDYQPNNATGWGRVDAVAAVAAAKDLFGPTGTISGEIISGVTGEPMPFVEINFPNGFPGVDDLWAAVTDADGRFEMEIPEGARAAFIDVPSFQPVSGELVTVTAGEVSEVVFELEPTPSEITVSGQVVDQATGWPLHSRIIITASNGVTSTVYTHPLTGHFSAITPAQVEFSLESQPLAPNATGAGFAYSKSTQSYSGRTQNLSVFLDAQADLVSCSAPGYSGSPCQAPSGHLLIGQVTLSGGESANGGVVSVDSTTSAATVRASADPELPGSMFYLFVPSGSQTITSSPPSGSGYAPVQATGEFSTGTVSTLDFTHEPQDFLVTVNLNGLQGAGAAVTVTLMSGAISSEIDFTEDGSQAFPVGLMDGASFSLSLAHSSSSPSQTCEITPSSGVIQGADVSVSVSCATNEFQIGGAVSGLEGSGLEISLNGLPPLTIQADGPFSFPTALPDLSSWAIEVTAAPTSPSQTCVIDPPAGTVTGQDFTSVSIACTSNQYQVTGDVSGLQGTGLSLSLNGGDSLSISDNGAFSFPVTLPDLSAWNIEVDSQPRSPAQTCSVSPASGSLNGADAGPVAVTCSTESFAIAGVASGLEGSGLTLSLNGGEPFPVSSNGAFSFPTTLPDLSEWSVEIVSQPQSPSQNCSVTPDSGVLAGEDGGPISVNCSTVEFSVSVSVLGLEGAGLELSLNGGPSLSIPMDGEYEFPQSLPDMAAWSISVVAQPDQPSQACSVDPASGTVSGEMPVTAAVTCSTSVFSIGGTVSGLGSGVVSISIGGNPAYEVTSDGTWQYPILLPDGETAIEIASQPENPNLACSVSPSVLSISGSDVTDVSIQCIPDEFFVAGFVEGLTGSGLVLALNEAENLAVAEDGIFVFETPLRNASAYSVAVATQPVTPAQHCSVVDGAGNIQDEDVIAVVVTCETQAFALSLEFSTAPAAGAVAQIGSNSVTATDQGRVTLPEPLLAGATYTIQIIPPAGYSCSVQSGSLSGTMPDSDHLAAQISCEPSDERPDVIFRSSFN